MTIPADIVRARLVFDLKQGTTVADQAVMGFHLARIHATGNPTDWPNDTQDIASKIWQKWVSNVTAVSHWSSAVALSRVDAYHLDTQGRTLDKGTQGVDGSHTAWAGTAGGSGSLPWETACAVSLYAYDPAHFDRQARHKRGRFYLPPFATSRMGNGAEEGRFDSSTIRDSIAPMMAAFINDVNGMFVGPTGPDLNQDVLAVGVLSQSANLFTQVTNVRVGHRPDSQRRRGRKLPESYETLSITPA